VGRTEKFLAKHLYGQRGITIKNLQKSDKVNFGVLTILQIMPNKAGLENGRNKSNKVFK
jgi:hypothetical protein